MKLIDNYFYMILKFLKRKKNTNFTELISVIKNKSTLSSKLKQLVAENIIIKKNGTYKLSEKGKKILNLLNEIKSTITPRKEYEYFDGVVKIFSDYLYLYLQYLKGKFEENLLSMVLFGSVARGNWTERSDIDILLIFSDNFQAGKDLDEIMIESTMEYERKNEIRKQQDRKLNIHIENLSLRFKELKRFKTLYYDIAMDGIILYDVNKTATKFLENQNEKMKNKKLRRIYVNKEEYYWKRENVQFGEVFEL